jgi:uncharacterized membrane protein YdjX (TVP38/TMEM64 family)
MILAYGVQNADEFDITHYNRTMAETTETKKINPITIIIVITTVVLILVFLFMKDLDVIRLFIQRSGWIGMVISILLYAVLGASPIPSEPLTVLITTSIGPLATTFVTGIGNLLSALIEYYLGHKISDAADFDRRRQKLPFGLGKLPVNSPLFLIGARMIPGYGPKFVSLIGGMYRVKIWRYIWTTAIAVFIGAAIFSYGGFGILNLVK